MLRITGNLYPRAHSGAIFENSIIVNLAGGLGNQLFQYSAGQALSVRNKLPLFLNLEFFEKSRDRKYELEQLRITANILPRDQRIQMKYQPRRTRALRNALALLSRPRHVHYVHELSPGYDHRLLQLNGPVILNGWFQSEKYFFGISDILNAEFQLKDAAGLEMHPFYRNMQCENAVSVHVRRGDYYSNPAYQKLYGPFPFRYYEEAFRRIQEYVRNAHFFIFTDEPDWVKENMPIDHPHTLIENTGGRSAAMDLMCMAACRYFIIANSTFSWWAAWLSTFKDKIVIAPKRWFYLDDYPDNDLLPPKWITI